MTRYQSCFALAAALLVAALASAKAQPPKDKPPPPEKEVDEYRRFFKKPETVADFWTALRFELDVGRYDLAAAHLRGLLSKKPTEDELVEIQQKSGSVAVLKLRNIRNWSDNKKVNAQALKDAEDLIGLVTAAVRKRYSDPDRIRLFIKNLGGSPEERAYALRELSFSGAQAIPYLIDTLRGTADPGERLPLLQALRRLGPETLPPLLAALDSDDALLKSELLDVLRRGFSRYGAQIVPRLWFLSASPAESDRVRKQATKMLSDFLDVAPSKLTPARVALVREAERYYRHQVPLGGADAVAVWRWDGKRVVQGWPGAPTVTATQAEEYWGLYYARRALLLDPSDRAAQEVFLSVALDKAMDRAGPAAPLARVAPDAHALLAKASPELVLAVLERGFRDRRAPLILAALRNLAVRAEVLTTRPGGKGLSPLVRALYYPDRHVQMAAVEAAIRTPDSVRTAQSPARVVDILRRALNAGPAGKARPKVVVGYFQEEILDRVARVVDQAGYEPIKLRTGRDVLRRLNQAADVDLLLLDGALPDPGLASLLGQVRSDRNNGQVPILLTITPPRPAQVPPKGRLQLYKPAPPPLGPDAEYRLRRFAERYPDVAVLPLAAALDAQGLQKAIQARVADPGRPALAEAELRAYAEQAVRHLADLAQGNPPGYDVRPAAGAILDALRFGKLSPEGQVAAATAASRVPGERSQTDLAVVIVDGARPAGVRVAAALELVRHIQRYGPLLRAAQIEPLRDLAAQPGLDAALKAALDVVMGSLRPGARRTGELLRDYRPRPPAVIPPPK
jgi:hypothetical protein